MHNTTVLLSICSELVWKNGQETKISNFKVNIFEWRKKHAYTFLKKKNDYWLCDNLYPIICSALNWKFMLIFSCFKGSFIKLDRVSKESQLKYNTKRKIPVCNLSIVDASHLWLKKTKPQMHKFSPKQTIFNWELINRKRESSVFCLQIPNGIGIFTLLTVWMDLFIYENVNFKKKTKKSQQ